MEKIEEILQKLNSIQAFIAAQQPAFSPLTVSEWLHEWLDTYKKNRVKVSTYTEYKRQIDSIIIPAIGTVRLQELRLPQVQTMLNGISHDNTRKKVAILLNASMEKAMLPSIGYIKENPCYGIELTRNEVVHHRRAYTLEEQNLLLQVLPEKYAKAFFFLCCTGLRIGEFLALTPDDVHKEEGIIIINKACDKKMHVLTPKTRSSVRDVFFHPSLFEVFPVELLGTYTHSAFHSQFVRTLKKERLIGVCIHSTRHTFATLCDYVRMNDKVTQAMLGHATLAMTKDTYTHLYKKGASPILTYILQLKRQLEG